MDILDSGMLASGEESWKEQSSRGGDEPWQKGRMQPELGQALEDQSREQSTGGVDSQHSGFCSRCDKSLSGSGLS